MPQEWSHPEAEPHSWQGQGGGPYAETAPRLANVIWWGTGVTDRFVNAAIWFGLEQISAAFWGQNNPALPICGGKRTVKSTAKYFRSKKNKKNSMVVGGCHQRLFSKR